VLGAAATLYACADASARRDNEAVMTTKPAVASVQIGATLEVNDRQMSLVYRLRNASDVDLYVMDALFELKEGEVRIHDGLAYTLIDGRRLTLLRGVLAIPPNVQVEAPEMPYARLLPAHGTLDGRFQSSLPLEYNNPYDFSGGMATFDCTVVTLRIGYLSSRELSAPPRRVPGRQESFFKIDYREAIQVQQLVETEEHTATVPVRRR